MAISELNSEVGQVTHPICRRFFTLFRLIGTILMIASLISDYTYILKQTFSSKLYYGLYLGILGFRILIPVLLTLRYQCINICGSKKELNEEEL